MAAMRLLPRETSFFDDFEEQGRRTAAGCRAFLALAEEPSNSVSPPELPVVPVAVLAPWALRPPHQHVWLLQLPGHHRAADQLFDPGQ